MRKKNKGKYFMKKDHPERYTEYKHKNIGASCMCVHTSRLHCFSSSTKC